MTEPLRVRVLGPLELERAGSPVRLGSRLQRRLLTALIVADGATVTVDRLADLLWGEELPPAARNSLQSHVARLRAALGDAAAIVTSPSGYQLAKDRVEVDARAFEAVVVAARAEVDGDPDGVVDRLTGALAGWRGAAFEEFADDLAHDEAARLDQLRSEARLLVAEALLRAGDLPGAIDGFARLESDAPLREDVVAGSARALAAAGRTADALETLQRFRRRLADELGLDPSPALADLERRILRGELVTTPSPVAASGGRSTVEPPGWTPPAPPPRLGTPTFGRDEDRDRVVAAMDRSRLVTLVGPGGVGKTRLATLVANALAADDGDVTWVDLSRAAGPDDVLPVLIETLALAGVDPADTDAVSAALGRHRGVAVFDNCEHVLDRIADVMDRALARAGPVQLLATSRERLDVAGEQVVQVAPLPVPDPDTATEDDPAVALFLGRLTAVGGEPTAPAAAARVAAAVDGLPLAIELAAARAAAIPVDELLARLVGHLDVLAGSGRRHGDRQRTLTSVIDWSHELLEARDRAVFRRLSMFAAPFRPGDAERVAGDADLPSPAVADALVRLVEQSMLTRAGEDRYRLLEPLRLYAAAQLARSGERDVVEERHRVLFLGLAARAGAALTGPDEAATIEQVEVAVPDLRAVHARALAQRDLATVARLTSCLYRFAYLQGRLGMLSWGSDLADQAPDDVPEGERLTAIAASVSAAAFRGHRVHAGHLASRYAHRLQDEGIAPATRLVLAETLGDLYVSGGDLEEAARAYEHNRQLAEELEHLGLRSFAIAGLSITRTFQGRDSEGESLAREAAALAQRSGSPSARSLAAYALGEALADREPDDALAAFDAAIVHASRVRARFLEGIARTADVAARGRHGDPAEALTRYRAALRLWYDAGAEGLVTTTLRNLVILFARIGADEAALTLDRALGRLVPHGSFGSEAHRLRTAVSAVRDRSTDATVERATTHAAGLAQVEDVVRFALATIDDAASDLVPADDVRAGGR